MNCFVHDNGSKQIYACDQVHAMMPVHEGLLFSARQYSHAGWCWPWEASDCSTEELAKYRRRLRHWKEVARAELMIDDDRLWTALRRCYKAVPAVQPRPRSRYNISLSS